MALDSETVELLLQDLENRLREKAAWAGLPVFHDVIRHDLAPLLETAPDVAYVLERVCDMLEQLGYPAQFPPLPPLPPVRAAAVPPGGDAVRHRSTH